ncbi:hypothetical protein GEMRC1_013178 [Eukaryota sp. GEM-RC1]
MTQTFKRQTRSLRLASSSEKLPDKPSDPPFGCCQEKPASSSSSKKKKPPPSTSSLRGTSSPECVVSSNKLLATSHDVSAVLEEGKNLPHLPPLLPLPPSFLYSIHPLQDLLHRLEANPLPFLQMSSPEKHACFDTCVENLNSSSLYPVTCPSCDSSLGTKKALYQHFNGGKCPNDFVPSSSFLSPYNLFFSVLLMVAQPSSQNRKLV